MGVCCSTPAAPEPPEVAAPAAGEEAPPRISDQQLRKLLCGPCQDLPPIDEATRPAAPSEEEMLDAILSTPFGQRMAQRASQREGYVDYLRRGHAGSTPAPFTPRPKRPPLKRMSSIQSLSSSDSSSLEDKIVAAMTASRSVSPPSAGR